MAGGAIHAYAFRLKKFMLTFILMIPEQVMALGFVQLVGRMKRMESVLSLSLVEAARIDGAGELHIFNRIVLPLMKPAVAVQAIFVFVPLSHSLKQKRLL